MMDICLTAGDVYLTSSGTTEYICAAREALQRTLIAATTTKGSFIYNRSLGTDYSAITDRERMTEKLDMLIREAAAAIADTEVTVTGYNAQRRTAALRLTHGGTTITTEVDLHGNL